MQRRFNHFVWLYEQLSNAYPGVIVPPIPEKQAIGMPAPCLVLPSRCALLADRPPVAAVPHAQAGLTPSS